MDKVDPRGFRQQLRVPWWQSGWEMFLGVVWLLADLQEMFIDNEGKVTFSEQRRTHTVHEVSSHLTTPSISDVYK